MFAYPSRYNVLCMTAATIASLFMWTGAASALDLYYEDFEDTTLQPNGDLPAVSYRARGAAGELAECRREASQRFVESAAPPGVDGGLLVGGDGLVVVSRFLEVPCDDTPVRFRGVRRVN